MSTWSPTGTGYRVRMRTHKGNVPIRAAVSGAFIFLAMFMILETLGVGPGFRTLLPAVMLGGAGLGMLVFTRATLPGWALERARQMEGLAERIPLLLKE